MLHLANEHKLLFKRKNNETDFDIFAEETVGESSAFDVDMNLV